MIVECDDGFNVSNKRAWPAAQLPAVIWQMHHSSSSVGRPNMVTQ